MWKLVAQLYGKSFHVGAIIQINRPAPHAFGLQWSAAKRMGRAQFRIHAPTHTLNAFDATYPAARSPRIVRSSAGHRAWAKIHKATIFTKGTKNAIVHHLFSPTRPRILEIGMAYNTRITTRKIHCHRLNGCMSKPPVLVANRELSETRYRLLLTLSVTFV